MEIDEINTKLNEISNNLDNHNNKEIENKNNKIFDNIDNKVIKELFVLNNNFSKNLEKEYKFSNFNYFDIDLDSVFQSSLLCGFTFRNRHRE